jgi:hypothetical protein
MRDQIVRIAAAQLIVGSGPRLVPGTGDHWVMSYFANCLRWRIRKLRYVNPKNRSLGSDLLGDRTNQKVGGWLRATEEILMPFFSAN